MSGYKVIEVIGTSATSWEDAAAQAIKIAGETLHDLRVAEVVKQDIHLDESGGITFRTKLELSFKYETSTDPGYVRKIHIPVGGPWRSIRVSSGLAR